MIQSLLIGIGLPFTLSLGLVLGSLFLPSTIAKGVRALAFPALFVFSYYHFSGEPPWPPNGSNESIFYIAAFSPLLALFRGRSFALSLIFAFLASAVATAMVLIPLLRFHGVDLITQIILLGLSTLGMLVWASLRQILTAQQKNLRWVGLLILTATFSGVSVHLLLNSSALLAFLAGTSASLSMACMLVQLKARATYDFRELAPFFSLLLVAFLACDYYYLDASGWMIGAMALPLIGTGFLTKQAL